MGPSVAIRRSSSSKAIVTSWEGADGVVVKISDSEDIHIRKIFFPWQRYDRNQKTTPRDPYQVELKAYEETWHRDSRREDSKRKIRCNVPRFYDHDDEQRQLRIQYISGQTLGDILETLPLDQYERYQEATLRIVKTLHRSGIAHNDIRDANIMIQHGPLGNSDAELDASIFLLDFGRAYLMHQNDYLAFFRSWEHTIQWDLDLLKGIFDNARREYHNRAVLRIIADRTELTEAEQRNLVDEFTQSGCNYNVIKELLKFEGLPVETVLALVRFMRKHGASTTAKSLIRKTLARPAGPHALGEAPSRPILMLQAYSNILSCGWTEEMSESLRAILQQIADLSDPCDPTIFEFRFKDAKKCWTARRPEAQGKIEALLIDLRKSHETHSANCKNASHLAVLKPILRSTYDLIQRMLADGVAFSFSQTLMRGKKRRREPDNCIDQTRDKRQRWEHDGS